MKLDEALDLINQLRLKTTADGGNHDKLRKAYDTIKKELDKLEKPNDERDGRDNPTSGD